MLGTTQRLSAATPRTYPIGGFLPSIVRPGNEVGRAHLTIWSHLNAGKDFYALLVGTQKAKQHWHLGASRAHIPVDIAVTIMSFMSQPPDISVFFIRIPRGCSIQFHKLGPPSIVKVFVIPTESSHHAMLVNNQFYFGVPPGQNAEPMLTEYRDMVSRCLGKTVKLRQAGDAVILDSVSW